MATSLSFQALAPTSVNFSIGENAGALQKSDRHGRELFLNHLWESFNAGAKVLFFAVVTPMMLSTWGREQFGLFAVANSCVALMAFLDLGLRTLTRVGLINAHLSESARLRLHALNFAAFSLAAAAGVAVVAILAVAGCWHHWLHLSPIGDVVIAATAALTAATMALQLLVERIAAAGNLSRIKAALFIGNILAFVVVVVWLHRGATVANVTTAYFAALGLPLLFLLPFADLHPGQFGRALSGLRIAEIIAALKSGGSINLITASWIFQSYGLVLLISWVIGPAAAGIFFLYLKLSELLSVLGASASEPTIAALAGAPTALDRHRNFAAGYRSVIALCLASAIGYTFFADDLFRVWLRQPLGHTYTGLLIGLFGVATGFSRMVTAASLGLAKPRLVALGLCAGAILIAGSVVAFHGNGGPEIILGIGCGTALFVVPAALMISRELKASFAETWLKPVLKFAPRLALITLVCWLAVQTGSLAFAAIAVLGSASICVRYIFRQSQESSVPRSKDSRLGYDTRSWRSALVMKGIDLLNPFRKAEPFSWAGPCVVSSIAGLGDLFVHLPLIAGIVQEADRRGLPIRVAMRPEHTAIGNACGWEVIAFDDTLVDVFKAPEKLRPLAIWNHIRQARRDRASLWIDLTGNAVSALAIKAAGARRLAARTTRGGRSLVNYLLPHTLHENEYGNVMRVAATLGCQPDYGVFARVRGEPIADLHDKVVLCLTTACRWRNWPLANFLALVDRFPETQFVVTGIEAEVAPEERATLETIVDRPNVVSCLDKISILQLIHLIAHANAVVTNDTSTAHIANAFRKSGTVLFGPASPEKLSAPYGLKSFADRTCPFHPCVQWTCRNQENWCMRKIDVDQVAGYLATLPAFGKVSARLTTQPEFIGLPATVAQL